MTEFGEWLRVKREARGYSQEEMALRLTYLGLTSSQARVSRIEAGQPVRLNHLQVILAALGVDVGSAVRELFE